MHGHVIMLMHDLFTHTACAFGVISLKDWVLLFWLSNLLLKLVKQVVNASIIFVTSLMLDTASPPFDYLGFPLSFLCPLGL